LLDGSLAQLRGKSPETANAEEVIASLYKELEI
jgi:hypothetical protein